ncbi:MAG: PilN domain-containing protein [Bdellovibrionales bacterium]
MIKVNLLQNRGSSARTQVGMTGVGGTATDFMGTSSGTASGTAGYTGSMSGANNKRLVINLIVVMLIPGALIYYERSNLEELRHHANITNAEVAELQNQIEQKKTQIAQSVELKEKAKELANKIDILKKLSRIRLREIKALDFIQASMPEKVWLREMSFKSGALLIRGYSMTDDDLTMFVRSLEKSRNFSSVVLLQAKEERSKDGAVKNFEVSCNVEAE